MFRNKWNITVDEKARIVLPAEIKGFGEVVFFQEGRDGCIRIFPDSTNLTKLNNDREVVIPARIDPGKRRLLIPSELRGSITFCCRPKITLVVCEGYLKLWPGWVPVV